MARGTTMTPNEQLILESLEMKLTQQRSILDQFIQSLPETIRQHREWNLPYEAPIENRAEKSMQRIEMYRRAIEQTKALIGNLKQGIVSLNQMMGS